MGQSSSASKASRVDHTFRRIVLTKLFTKGWGNPEDLKRIFDYRKIMSNRDKCRHLVSADHPIYIDKEEVQKEVRVLSGHFTSPLVDNVPGIMPQEVQTASFEVILPRKWDHKLKPICIHLAGTGDHGFQRRRMKIARPLAKEAGIASILLENPYYGTRKPKEQFRSSLRYVSDLFVMGGALIVESLALLHWCEKQGYGPLGISGVSMGGHMASLAATNWHKPLSLVPCLSLSTASGVYTQGILSNVIPWPLLQAQYFADSRYWNEVAPLIVSPEMLRKKRAFTQDDNLAAMDYRESLAYMQNYHNGSVKDTTQLPQQEGHKSTSQNVKSSHSQSPSSTSSSQQDPSNSNRLPSKTKRIIDKLKISNKIYTRSGEDNKAIALQTAKWFMRGCMDQCTHLGNYSVPVDPSLIINVMASRDAYMPRDDLISLQELWPGSQLREVEAGHMMAIVTKTEAFNKAIMDSFDLQIQKYYQDGSTTISAMPEIDQNMHTHTHQPY